MDALLGQAEAGDLNRAFLESMGWFSVQHAHRKSGGEGSKLDDLREGEEGEETEDFSINTVQQSQPASSSLRSGQEGKPVTGNPEADPNVCCICCGWLCFSSPCCTCMRKMDYDLRRSLLDSTTFYDEDLMAHHT